jgi:RNA polymerase sigma factor (sigma-70 family)
MERSDAELLEASRRGEREAFGALVERYQAVVCAVSYSRIGDRALSEDVAQDTFLAAWRQLDQLRDVERLRAWLCGIARNLASKARRRRAREAPLEESPLPCDAATPFEQLSDTQSEQLVRDALHRVPEAYRDALVLYYREQRSVRQVAATLGISEAAALQRLSRGRQCLSEGVHRLVERSLRGALPRRSLVAGVLAALPALAPTHANATPASHGGPMIKIAIAAVSLTAFATIAYVATAAGRPAPSLAAAPPSAGAPPHRAPAVAAQLAPRPSSAPLAPARRSAAPPADVAAPAAALPVLDAATVARTKLYEGPSRGAADAPITVAVFTDMQCRFCADALGELDQLLDDAPGKVRLVVKQLPVHKTAELAAEAALAADSQGKFWELHDLMLAHQDDLSRDALLALAARGGLDVAALRSALDTHAFADAVKREASVAAELGLEATPSFVINGRRVIGDLRAMRAAVDEELAALGER